MGERARQAHQDGEHRPVAGEVPDEPGVAPEPGLGDVVAQRGEGLGGRPHHPGGLGVGRAAEQVVGDEPDPQPAARRALDQTDRRQGAVRPEALGGGEVVRGVADGPGDHALGDQVDRQAADTGLVQQPAAGRFETDEAGDGGGDADRPAAVVGVREGHGAGGDQGGGPAGGGPRGVAGVPGVAGGCAVVELRARGEAELGHRGLAQHHEALREELLGRCAGARRRARHEGGRAVAGGQPGDVDVVLDEGGHSGEHPAGGPVGALPRPAGAVGLDGVEQGVDVPDAGDRGVEDLAAAEGARADGGGQRDGVEVPEGVVGEGVDRGHRVSFFRR